MVKVELADGEYTVIDELSEGGGFRALRHGEEWRDLAGDNLVLAMFYEIERLQKERDELHSIALWSARRLPRLSYKPQVYDWIDEATGTESERL